MWRPTATIDNLKLRAKLLARIRQFFAEKEVLEVETPLLCHSTIPDQNILSFSSSYKLPGIDETLYLQTSPEFAMKRLLAAGAPSIYQICKAFRYEGYGKQHNPEFTILEWYRLGFDHHKLMQEMDEFLQFLIQTKPAHKITYQELFIEHLNLDPIKATYSEIKNCAIKNGLNHMEGLSKDDWLDLLLTHKIEKQLGKNNKPTFIYNYPKSQAALAKLNEDKLTAARFEVYIEGVELANGFYELTSANEQRQRFLDDLKKREALGIATVPLDERFLQALEHGLPDCAGVALGIDRLLMAKSGVRNISEVLSFNVTCA
ncbi:MAG: EF-P lysine aminoacylase GenX [Gammaproteobacteria bacterium]|nr:EF-P lysine aminoacylase GenX [Gammaproteobacteria bacterium]